MIEPGTVGVFGGVAVLNVGQGDTKLTFDKSNPAEVIRAGRIVKDMLRRGYALLVEVERDGVKKFERALDFDESKAEYIIADFDPVTAEKADQAEAAAAAASQEASNGTETIAPARAGGGETAAQAPASRRGRRRGVDAGSTRAVAVARTAGG